MTYVYVPAGSRTTLIVVFRSKAVLAPVSALQLFEVGAPSGPEQQPKACDD